MNRVALITMLLLVAGGAAAQQGSDHPIQRIIPGGADGGSVYYRVICKSGETGTVVIHEEENRICAYPRAKGQDCRTTWDLNAALIKACQ